MWYRVAAMAVDHITAEPAPRWLDNPDFLRLFLRMFVNASAIGGVPECVKLVASLVDASGTPPQAVFAKLKTYLLTYDPEHITFH
jgi:hypothetical protein